MATIGLHQFTFEELQDVASFIYNATLTDLARHGEITEEPTLTSKEVTTCTSGE